MTETVDSIYGHDALVLYLQDVRDLEMMLAMFKARIIQGDRELAAARRQYLTPNKVPVPEQSKVGKAGSALATAYLGYLLVMTAIMTVVCLAGAIGALGSASTDAEGIAIGVGGSGGVVMLAVIDYLLYRAIKKRKDKRVDAREAAIRHNEEDDRRLKKNRSTFPKQFEQPWARKKDFLQGACQSVENARNQCYALNIIPGQYRKLEAVQYLYEFMSTSRQPFSQALDHAQIEEGIRRIEAKLNVIISQNEAQLRKLASIEANTETLIKQGFAILSAQVATAHYASAAAAHARAIDAKLENMQSYIQYGF